LRIALLSREFPSSVLRGGIGTYMQNLADMLAARGHNVEVFCAGSSTEYYTLANGVRVNSIAYFEGMDFAADIVEPFVSRHAKEPFEVVEAAEFLAHTSRVTAALPDLPLVIKLHTPSVFIKQIDRSGISLSAKARFILGGLLRGKLVKPYWSYNRATDYELHNLSAASEVTSPCDAMVTALGSIWNLDQASVAVIPNVFAPHPELLKIPEETQTRRVLFVGRLEFRKGVTDLAEAIPRVLDSEPDARFRLVGRSLPHPRNKMDLREFLLMKLGDYADRVEFISGLGYEDTIRNYADADICAFPSRWENFPNVCLEAMAAARGVIGSSAGGMSEMIAHERTGLLVPPKAPKALAEAIIRLLRNPEARVRMGRAARAHVCTNYNFDTIGPQHEASYDRAIARKRRGLRYSQQLGAAG
jgi:glycogen synthase